MSDNPIHQAVELAKAGKKKDAQRIISSLLQQNTDNVDAWIIMAQLVDDDQMALDCWQQVLRLRPNDDKARQRIEQLQQKLRVSPSAQAEPDPAEGTFTPLGAPQAVTTASEATTKRCPYCAETILAEAIKCRYCGSDLRSGMGPGAQAASYEPRLTDVQRSGTAPIPVSQEEQTILRARLSPFTPTFILRVIFTFGLYLLWWRREELVITNRRVIAHTGLIGRTERTALLSKVQDVTIKSGLIGRLFNYGNILIETAGSLRAEFIVKGFENPERIKDTIMRLSWGEVVLPQEDSQSPLVPTLVGVGTLVACLACCGLAYASARPQPTVAGQPSGQRSASTQTKAPANSQSTLKALASASCKKDTSDYIDKIKSPMTEFSDAFSLAGSTSRIALSPVIQNMQSARRDIVAIDAPDCAKSAAKLTTDGMDSIISAFIDFEGNAPDATIQRELADADLKLTTGFNQLKALAAGQPTPALPTLTATSKPRATPRPTATPAPQSMGSSIVVNDWEIQVTKIETVKQFDYFGSTYKAKGRFAILFLTVINRSRSPNTFTAIGSLVVQDATGNTYDEDSTTVFAQDLYKADIGANINPDASAHVVSVFDISENSSSYYLVPGILADNTGWNILLQIP